MKTLNTIQKTIRIFGIFTKIAYVFSIIGAASCAVGAICAVAGYNGGQLFTLFGKPVILFSGDKSLNEILAVLLTDLVYLSSEAILLGFACQYVKTEQTEGTPFGVNGPQLLKRLGIRCVYLPIVAAALASTALVCLDVEKGGDYSNLPSVATGIFLILISLIFRYGGELEQGSRTEIADKYE